MLMRVWLRKLLYGEDANEKKEISAAELCPACLQAGRMVALRGRRITINKRKGKHFECPECGHEEDVPTTKQALLMLAALVVCALAGLAIFVIVFAALEGAVHGVAKVLTWPMIVVLILAAILWKRGVVR